MTDESTAVSNWRIRFGLRHLFVAIAVIAILAWGGLQFYEWAVSVPLNTAVATFNSRVSADPALRSMPPLTEDEIVAAINAELKLPELTSNREVTAILRRIANSRRLPKDVWLEMDPNYVQGSADRVWRIDLNAMTSKTSGYEMVIRRMPKPTSLGKDEEPKGFSTPRSPLEGP